MTKLKDLENRVVVLEKTFDKLIIALSEILADSDLKNRLIKKVKKDEPRRVRKRSTIKR